MDIKKLNKLLEAYLSENKTNSVTNELLDDTANDLFKLYLKDEMSCDVFANHDAKEIVVSTPIDTTDCNKAQYDELEKKIETFTINTDDYSLSAAWDESGYDYWKEENNPVSCILTIKRPLIVDNKNNIDEYYDIRNYIIDFVDDCLDITKQ